MTDIVQIGFSVDTSQIKQGHDRLAKMGDTAKKTERSIDSMSAASVKSFSAVKASIASAAVALTSYASASRFISVAREFDVLNASLVTATRSSEAAATAFESLSEFASTTPYSLQQSVNGFVKLVNLGLEPSEKALESYGNTAAAMGKDLNQMIEAVADASVGEFERLKEFGIKASTEGNKVAFTFQGVTTTVRKNAQEIQNYLLSIGNVNFAGAMEARAKTLDGAISNLSDSFDALLRSISAAGVGNELNEAIRDVTSSIDGLTDNIDHVMAGLEAAAAVASLAATPALLKYAASVYAAGKASLLAGTEATVMSSGLVLARNSAVSATIATNALGIATRFLLGPWGLLLSALGAATIAYNLSSEASDKQNKSLENQLELTKKTAEQVKLLSETQRSDVALQSQLEINDLKKQQLSLEQQLLTSSFDSNQPASLTLATNEKLAKIKARILELEGLIKAAQSSEAPKKVTEETNEAYEKQIKALKSLAEQLGLTSDELVVYNEVQKSIARGDTKEQTAEIEKQARAYIQLKNEAKAFSDLITGQDNVYDKNPYQQWIDGISTVTTKTQDLQEEIKKVKFAMAEGDISETVGKEYIADLEKQIKALDVNPFQSMTDGAQDALQAMSGMFENGSKDAKKLAIAMQALNLVQAVGAVLNQGSGDPYTAFGRMASMAAMVASLGMSIGGLAGDFEDKSAARQASQNVNQWGDKSESILDATESTANATEKLVGINTDMLSALKNLSMALSSASGIIAKGINTPTASPSIYNIKSIDLINGVIPELVGSFDLLAGITQKIPKIVSSFDIVGNAIASWLSGSSSVTDEGIRIIGGQISDLIENVTVQAFQEVDYKKWRFGKTKSTTAITDLSNEVGNQFSLVFESLADTVATGASMLGISTDDIERVINNFVIDTSSISLKGLSSDDQIKEIEAYFSNVFNNLSSTVIPFLSDFQKAGEELGETLSRLSSQASIGQYLVKNFGLELGSTSNVIWEGTGIWSGLKVEVLGVASQFVLATNAISEMVGGVDEFASKVSSFTNNFADDSKKLEIYGNAVSSALEDVGLSLPASARGFYDLFTSINASTAAGQEQVAALLDITETASAYYDMLEDINNEMLSKELSYLGGEIANITSRISDLSVGYRSAAESLYDIGFAAESVSLDAAIAAARLGDLDLASSLDLSALTPERSDFASLVDYNIARAETAAKLTELQNIQDNTVDVNERQLSVLEQIRDALSDTSQVNNTAEITAELASLREQSYMQTELTNDLLRRLAYTRPEAVQ